MKPITTNSYSGNVLWARILGNIVSRIDACTMDPIWDRIWSRIGDRLWNQARNEIRDRL